jgi:hypothetical protein
MPKRVITEQQKRQHTIYMRTWRKENPEKNRSYGNTIQAKLARHERHVKRSLLVRNGDIVVSEEQRQKQREAERSWQERNQNKHRAEHIASKIPIGDECELCGDTDRLVRHHPDYDYPTVFVTCCQSCHRNIHSNIIEPISAGNTASLTNCARSPTRRALVMQSHSSLTLCPTFTVAAELEQTRIGHVQEGLAGIKLFCPSFPFSKSGIRKPSRYHRRLFA